MSEPLNLVVTLSGRPVKDQELGIQAFKDACLASSKTPPHQVGTWTLTAPDGRTWQADSPLKACWLGRATPDSILLAVLNAVASARMTPESGAEALGCDLTAQRRVDGER